MSCLGCGNPFCRAGRLYQAYLTARFYLVLGVPFLPPLFFGAFMPLPWAFGATVLYVGAGSQLMLAAGKALINQVSAAKWREAGEQIATLGGGVDGLKGYVSPCDDAPVRGTFDDEDGPEPPPSAPGGEA